MREYFHSIILITALSQLILLALPDKEQDTYKKTMRFICSTAVLGVICQPFSGWIEEIRSGISVLPDSVYEWGEEVGETECTEEAMWRTVLQKTADQWIGYIADQYDMEREDISMVFITSEEEYTIEQIQIFLQMCPYTVRKSVEEDVRKQMDPIPVFVFGEQEA